MSPNQKEKTSLDKFCDFVMHGKDVTSIERSEGLEELKAHTETVIFRLTAPELTNVFLAVAQKDIRPGQPMLGQQQQVAAAEALHVISGQYRDPKVEMFFDSLSAESETGQNKIFTTNNIKLRNFAKARRNSPGASV